MYEPHPNHDLNARFKAKPYQGAEPEHAEFVFVGLDANYPADLELDGNLPSVLEYHEDGSAFWRRHKVHHPFLLGTFRGDRRCDGVPYHRGFTACGFLPDDADRVSFIELLNVPTVGRSMLEPRDLNDDHLERLAALMLDGRKRHVFVCQKAMALLRQKARFEWMPPAARNQVLPMLQRVQQTRLYQNLHFSSYGAVQQRRREEARAISTLAAGVRTSTFALHACAPRRAAEGVLRCSGDDDSIA